MRSTLATAILLTLLFSVPARSQGAWISKDYDFAVYLIDNDLKRDAAKLLSGSNYNPSDTLTWLRGWSAYQLKELSTARMLLKAVPAGSPFKDRSIFYSTAVSAHMGDYTPSCELEAYTGPFAELKGLQMAGLALLRDDPESFKRAAAAFTYSDYTIQDAERKLDDIFASRYSAKSKSPWLAAGASALVPGLGKIYAGKLGEGIAAFLLTGAAAAITAEHWVKDGPSDWKTIVPGILCGALYIGNIYGSYMSVSIYNQKIRNEQQTAILYNIHIPLRSVFK